MRKITILFALILYTSYSILHTPAASAHFVKSDGGIGAVLHVDPGDDPVAGKEANIILEFKDISNKFNLNNCSCKIILTTVGGKEILNEDLKPIAKDQELSSVTPVTFPAKDIYKLKITGNSSNSSHPAFELNYDIRVEKEDFEQTSDTRPENWLSKYSIYLSSGLLILILLIFALVKQNYKK